jgi:hypothetical protein
MAENENLFFSDEGKIKECIEDLFKNKKTIKNEVDIVV